MTRISYLQYHIKAEDFSRAKAGAPERKKRDKIEISSSETAPVLFSRRAVDK
jgi:hypothetical protein